MLTLVVRHLLKLHPCFGGSLLPRFGNHQWYIPPIGSGSINKSTSKTISFSCSPDCGPGAKNGILESVSTGVWCVLGLGAGFEIALEPSELQK